MKKLFPVIDADNCTGCYACIDACGPQSLDMEAGVAVLARSETCTGEAHCVDACPTHAVTMEWTPPAA